MADLPDDDALAARKAAVEAKAAEMLRLLQHEAATAGHDAARIAADGALLGIMRWYGTLKMGHELIAAICGELELEAYKFIALRDAAAPTERRQ